MASGGASSEIRTDGGPNEDGVSSGNLAVLDALDLPVFVISHDCKVVHANDAALKVLRVTASDIGRSPGQILPAETSLDQLCAQVFADGTPCRREIRIGDHSFLLRIAPYTGDGQKIVGAILTFTNVTAFRASIDQAIYEREYTKAILNTVADPLVVLDAEMRIQTGNRAFYTLFGVSRDETQGVSISVFGNDEWKTSKVWAAIKLALSGQSEFQAVEIDRAFPGVGDRTIVMEARRVARDSAGMILLAFRDITSRKRAEMESAALMRRERQAHEEAEALNEVAHAIGSELDLQKLVQIVTDIATKLTHAKFGAFFYNVFNDQGESYMLYTLSGASREAFEKFGMMPRNTPVFQTTFSGLGPRRSDDIKKDPDYGTMAPHFGMPQGHLPVSSYLAVPVKSRSGEVLGGLFFGHPEPGVFTESSERLAAGIASHAAIAIDNAELFQRAEQQARASRASEERLRLTQRAAKIGVFAADIQTGANSWSQELEELHGLRPGTFGGTQSEWESLLHPEDRETALKRVEDALRTGLPTEGEWRVIWPDGSVHWLAGRFQVHNDAGGTLARMSGVNFEITERKRIENELRRANQDLEQFAYSASHDLQEPLRSVTIFSELLSGRYGDKLDGQALEFLGNVRDGARRMEMLVRDLLAYTQAATLDTEPEPVDANAVMQAAIANLAGTIAEAGATVNADPLPSVRIHAIHLQQVFQNLISNALKYHQPGIAPVVQTTARRQDGMWRFSVTDNGIGIEPRFHERIFGLFKRLHTGDEYSGTGIGLALCQRIVERNHGRIWVESEPGKGSSFHFTLPA
jgi:PAS domain S-box-containing protein